MAGSNSRKSPSRHAAGITVGKIMTSDNDGRRYIVKEDKNGRHYWAVISQVSKPLHSTKGKPLGPARKRSPSKSRGKDNTNENIEFKVAVDGPDRRDHKMILSLWYDGKMIADWHFFDPYFETDDTWKELLKDGGRVSLDAALFQRRNGVLHIRVKDEGDRPSEDNVYLNRRQTEKMVKDYLRLRQELPKSEGYC